MCVASWLMRSVLQVRATPVGRPSPRVPRQLERDVAVKPGPLTTADQGAGKRLPQARSDAAENLAVCKAELHDELALAHGRLLFNRPSLMSYVASVSVKHFAALTSGTWLPGATMSWPRGSPNSVSDVGEIDGQFQIKPRNCDKTLAHY